MWGLREALLTTQTHQYEFIDFCRSMNYGTLIKKNSPKCTIYGWPFCENNHEAPTEEQPIRVLCTSIFQVEAHSRSLSAVAARHRVVYIFLMMTSSENSNSLFIASKWGSGQKKDNSDNADKAKRRKIYEKCDVWQPHKTHDFAVASFTTRV